MTSDEEFRKQLSDAVEAHVKETVGVPLSRIVCVARAITYLSVLFHVYDMGDEQLGAVVDLARRTQISTMRATGSAPAVKES